MVFTPRSCSLRLVLFYVIQDHLQMGGNTLSDLGSPTSIISEENAPTYRPLCWEHFLSPASLFSDDSSLCQVDKTLPSPQGIHQK